MPKIYSFILLGVVFCKVLEAQPTIRYVRTDGITSATDALQATSWEKACNDLQAVLHVSASGDQVWVAAGTYFPIRKAYQLTQIDSVHSDNAFVLKSKVRLFGGFFGNESPNFDLSKRNFSSNPSILSGVIHAGDTHSDSVCHVVVAVSGSKNDYFYVDGFTITGGSARRNGSVRIRGVHTVPRNQGGGILAQLNGENSTLIIRNNEITGNGAGALGGGAFIYLNGAYAEVYIEGNTFSKNSVLGEKHASGGGIFIAANASNAMAVIADNTISENKVWASVTATGGGIYGTVSDAYASLTITDNTISGNHVTTLSESGASASGGGVFASASFATTQLSLLKNTISGNKVQTNISDTGGYASGGGLYLSATDAAATAAITQNNITRNSMYAYHATGTGMCVFATINSRVDIVQNHIFKNETYAFHSIGWGIYATAISHSSLTLTQNNILKNTVEAYQSTGNGFYTFASSGAQVSTRQNTVNGNQVILKNGEE